jgi:hypothetical protein
VSPYARQERFPGIGRAIVEGAADAARARSVCARHVGS